MLYDRWAKGFQYIADQGIAPILVGEFGGRQTGTDTVEGVWQRQFMDHLARKGYSWTYWAWNPNSGDTGGVLSDDWVTVNQPKMDLLTLLINRQPVPFPPPGSSTTTSTPPPSTSTSTTRPPSTSTTSSSSTTTTTRPPTGVGLTARFVLQSQWQTGYCGYLEATNSTGSRVNGLRFSFDLGANNLITSSWNGMFVRSGATVSVSLPDWARTLAAGARYTQTGFCVQGQGLPTRVTALGG